MTPNIRLQTETPEANGQAHEPPAPEPAPSPYVSQSWLLTLDDLCRLLQRCRRSLEGDLAAGRIGPKPIRFGRALRFDADECLAWRAAGFPPRDRWTWHGNGQDIRSEVEKRRKK